MLQAFRLSISSNLTGESRLSRLSSRHFFGLSERKLDSNQSMHSKTSGHSSQHEKALQITDDTINDHEEEKIASRNLGKEKKRALIESMERKNTLNNERKAKENEIIVSQLTQKKGKRRKERNKQRRHNSVEHRTSGKKIIRRHNSTGDQPSDISGWGLSMIRPIYNSRSRRRKKSLRTKGCSACALMESRYNNMSESYELKLHSRDTVICSFENASTLQQEMINNLREETEKKNSVIASLKNDQVKQKAKGVTMSLDLEIEKKTTTKLYEQIEKLQAEFDRFVVKAEEKNRKSERDVKKLNELVYLQKKQLKAKDKALQQILTSYQERKKTIKSLVTNIHTVESDLMSHISDNVTHDSRRFGSFRRRGREREENNDELTLEDCSF